MMNMELRLIRRDEQGRGCACSRERRMAGVEVIFKSSTGDWVNGQDKW